MSESVVGQYEGTFFFDDTPFEVTYKTTDNIPFPTVAIVAIILEGWTVTTYLSRAVFEDLRCQCIAKHLAATKNDSGQ